MPTSLARRRRRRGGLLFGVMLYLTSRSNLIFPPPCLTACSNIRGDVMDRAPAELAKEKFDGGTAPGVGGDPAGSQASLQDIMCFTDYNVAGFHTNSSPSHRLSLTSEASIAAVSHQLLHRVSSPAALPKYS